MMHLEELLPYLRIGGRIRHESWDENSYIFMEKNIVYLFTHNKKEIFSFEEAICNGFLSDKDLLSEKWILSVKFKTEGSGMTTPSYFTLDYCCPDEGRENEYTEKCKKKTKTINVLNVEFALHEKITFKEGDVFGCKALSEKLLRIIEIAEESGRGWIHYCGEKENIELGGTETIIPISLFLTKLGIENYVKFYVTREEVEKN